MVHLRAAILRCLNQTICPRWDQTTHDTHVLETEYNGERSGQPVWLTSSLYTSFSCTLYYCCFIFLSYYGEIVVRSKLSTPRLLGDSVLSGNIPLQWAEHSLLCDWVISDFCKLRLLKWLRDLFSYLTVQLWFLCKLVLDIFPARATQYSPWYLTYFWHTSTLDLAPSMILQLHALVRLTSCIWSTTYNNSYRFSVVSTSLIVRFIPQAYTVCLEI